MEDVADYSIRKARDNLSKWEDLGKPLAPLSVDERETVLELSSVASLRTYPKLVVSSPSVDVATSSVGNLTFQIHSSSQFLRWFDDVQQLECSGNAETRLEYVDQLNSHRQECEALLHQLQQALHHLTHLHTQYVSVSDRTTALHTACEHLLEEQTRLSATADSIAHQLSYYTQVDAITQKLASPAFTVTSEGFMPLLTNIDNCILFMKDNDKSKECSVYLARYMHCLSRAHGLIRSYIFRSFVTSTKNVMPKPGEANPTSDNATVLYYSKFRTNAPRIKSLINEIEKRLSDGAENSNKRSDLPTATSIPYDGSSSLAPVTDGNHFLLAYQNLLQDCHHCYFQQRELLLCPSVSDAVRQLVTQYKTDHCSLVRSGCSFLVHVCEDEHNLYEQFFTRTTPQLDVFLERLCNTLYDNLRPLIIHIDHLETLSELCTILRRGMIEEHLQSNPRQLSALRAVVTRMLEDAQERLVYRTHIYITSDILGYVPSPGDLAYPSKLQLMEQIALQIADNRRLTRSSDTVSVASSSGGEGRFSRVGSSPADLHGMWYPTLRRTLLCLSKLYRCVDRAIFQGVSLDAVSACVSSLSSAATAITAGPKHAALFQIKHLLILREQLAPFQMESSLKETSLDWSKLKDAAYGLVQQRAKIFSLTSNNALLQFIVDGTPQVHEEIMDSKRDVDNELKKVCEQLIVTSTNQLVSPLVSLVKKIEVILEMNKNENTVKPISLKNQPFSTPEQISQCMSTVCQKIRSRLPSLHTDLHLYLANKDTEFILLKPVRMNIIRHFSRLTNILNANYNQEDITIANCPSSDELNMMMNALLERESSVTLNIAPNDPTASDGGDASDAPQSNGHNDYSEHQRKGEVYTDNSEEREAIIKDCVTTAVKDEDSIKTKKSRGNSRTNENGTCDAIIPGIR